MLRPASLTACLILALAPAAFGQTYKAPRTALGQPDLQGLWDNDSMTRLQRPKAFKALVATPEEVAAFEGKGFARFDKVIAPVNPDEPAPPPDGVTDDDRFERPQGLARVRGEARSSQIVDPADGRLPYTPAARAAADKALADEEIYDDPEARPFDERCLLGGGGGVAAPIINRHHVLIVQTAEHVVLFGEQNHEARIVRMKDRTPLPSAIRPWMGDSVGRWDGDTLVVVTTGLSPNDGWRWNAGDWIRLTPQARITERFKRVAKDELLYSFEIDDPGAYTQVWKGEHPFKATTVPIYEYACHEGNYALANILAGGRVKDREAAAASAATAR